MNRQYLAAEERGVCVQGVEAPADDRGGSVARQAQRGLRPLTNHLLNWYDQINLFFLFCVFDYEQSIKGIGLQLTLVQDPSPHCTFHGNHPALSI